MDFKKILEAIKLAVALVPLVEAAIPIPKKGQDKLALILGIITDTMGGIDTILPLIKSVINRTVKAANDSGAFKTGITQEVQSDNNTLLNE